MYYSVIVTVDVVSEDILWGSATEQSHLDFTMYFVCTFRGSHKVKRCSTFLYITETETCCKKKRVKCTRSCYRFMKNNRLCMSLPSLQTISIRIYFPVRTTHEKLCVTHSSFLSDKNMFFINIKI